MTSQSAATENRDGQQPSSVQRRGGAVVLFGISKDYGITRANDRIDFTVNPGEVVGLVGGNGAGKSTLMKILSGEVTPTGGSISFAGERVDPSLYDAAAAHAHGVRMVHQELSLCTNLSVAENFFLEASDNARPFPGWRGRFRDRALRALGGVFPEAGIGVDENVGRLSISERQMVEIARAVSDPDVRLIILDEPTSSLDQRRAAQLRSFIRRMASEGVAFIFISHKLEDIIDIATDVVVLRNGRLAWRGKAADATIGRLVGLMGGNVDMKYHGQQIVGGMSGCAVLRLTGDLTAPLGRDVEIGRGEIVGLAGLEGNGQRELLRAVFAPRGRNAGVTRSATASFIAGDRQKEGVFPQWNVLANISIGRTAKRAWASLVSDQRERSEAAVHASRLGLDASAFRRKHPGAQRRQPAEGPRGAGARGGHAGPAS